jgi:ribose 5-phosphate isomerase A
MSSSPASTPPGSRVAATETLKHAAAARALEEVHGGMVLGLGSGSTVAHFLDLLGRSLASGALRHVVGVPSSVGTESAALELGIPLTTLEEHPRLDLTVDGADEVSPRLDLIKGMGGALLREKMIAQASSRFVIIVDEGKAVERLGTLSPLPVEVVEWEWRQHVRFLEARGASVHLRQEADGSPFRSDNGNLILHSRFPEGIPEPGRLDAELRARAGVVGTGLFLGMADVALLAGPDGVRILERPA